MIRFIRKKNIVVILPPVHKMHSFMNHKKKANESIFSFEFIFSNRKCIVIYREWIVKYVKRRKTTKTRFTSYKRLNR